MRIVAGTLRGRTIDAPTGEGTRPTIDRVREALFSSLYSLRGGFEGAVVLDAFAGSGALGLEALSRGAAEAVFCERDARASVVCEHNVVACDMGSRATVMRCDVMRSSPIGHVPPFDLVFLDPPYEYDAAQVLEAFRDLPESAITVYEHAAAVRDEIARAAHASGFSVVSQRKYGKTGITILNGARCPRE